MATISLVMIVKDEEEILRKSVDSVKSIIDEFIIVDTGSTDKTKEIIAEYGQVHEIPFVDFVQTKNEALKLATGDYIFFMDADEIVVSGLEKLKEYVEKGENAVSAYIIEGAANAKETPSNIYFRCRLWKNNGDWYFEGPGVHEVICGTGQITYDKTIQVKHEHIKKNKPELMHQWSLKYVEILKKAVEKDPKDTRALFYLARTYRDLNRHTLAIDTYEEYLSIPGNNFLDERWQAAYDIAICWKAQGEYSKVIPACQRAIEIDPRRAAAYNLMGYVHYNCMDWDNAIPCFQQALQKKIPEDVVLFLNPREYKDIPLDYMAICFDRKKKYDLAYKACSNISQGDLSSKTRILENMSWLQSKVNMTIFMTLGHTPEPVYGGMIDKVGVGGVETTYIELSSELAKKGHNVFLFCECEEEQKWNGVYYIPYQKISEYTQLSPDVVITSRWFDALYMEQKSKKIIWLQDAHFADPNHNDAFSIADGVVCSSLWHRGYIGERFQHGIDNKKITIIPLGIRKELYIDSIPRDPFKCIYSSNPDRGLYVLVDMWDEITKRIPKIKLVITYGWDGLMTWGKNKQWEDSVNLQKQQTIDKLAKFDNVEFKGRLTKRQLAREMLTCSLCLYPNNFWETHCLTALETQAAGVPMITTDRGALATTLNPHYNKLICNDPYTQKYKDIFINTMDEMLKDRNKLKLNSVGCKDFVMESPTDWKDIAGFWQDYIWSLF